jgi:hypothetical protein
MATIPIGNDTVVSGTSGNDSMTGTASPNTNDTVNGLQGDDTINFPHGVLNSTIHGNQGNDIINLHPHSGNDVIYGDQGNDTISATNDFGDTFYGGQGNDSLSASIAVSDIFYGGQGNDTIVVGTGGPDIIYGNQGDDLLFGHNIGDSQEYGGQGNDTLVFTGTGFGATSNDAETGGQGADLFIASNDQGGNAITHPDNIVTVTDFLSGTDKLSETHVAGLGLHEINDAASGNAQVALTDANNFYSSVGNSGREYVFVYGGTGAGYLFYNGDSGGFAARSGMELLGATGENSVMLNDITTIPAGINA